MKFSGLNFNNFIIDDVLDIAISEHKKRDKKDKKKKKKKSKDDQDLTMTYDEFIEMAESYKSDAEDTDLTDEELSDAFSLKLPESKEKESKPEKKYYTIG